MISERKFEIITNYKNDIHKNKNQALSFVDMELTRKNHLNPNCKIEEKLKENEILP